MAVCRYMTFSFCRRSRTGSRQERVPIRLFKSVRCPVRFRLCRWLEDPLNIQLALALAVVAEDAVIGNIPRRYFSFLPPWGAAIQWFVVGFRALYSSHRSLSILTKMEIRRHRSSEIHNHTKRCRHLKEQ